MESTQSLGIPTEDIVVGITPFRAISDALEMAGMSTQDAQNETMDYFCRQSGGRLVRALDVFVGDDGYAHAFGWRVG